MNSAENVQHAEAIQEALKAYKFQQQRATLNALFISLVVFIVLHLIFGFVFLLVPVPGLLIGIAVVQLIWFSLLAAIVFILAQALILPLVGLFGVFVGFFIIFIVFFLVAFGLGIAAAVTLNVVIGIFFVVFQFLWHLALVVILGLILFSIPVALPVAVGFYSLLIILLFFFDLVFVLTIAGTINLVGGIVSLIFLFILILASLLIVLVILIQQTNIAGEKKKQE